MQFSTATAHISAWHNSKLLCAEQNNAQSAVEHTIGLADPSRPDQLIKRSLSAQGKSPRAQQYGFTVQDSFRTSDAALGLCAFVGSVVLAVRGWGGTGQLRNTTCLQCPRVTVALPEICALVVVQECKLPEDPWSVMVCDGKACGGPPQFPDVHHPTGAAKSNSSSFD